MQSETTFLRSRPFCRVSNLLFHSNGAVALSILQSAVARQFNPSATRQKAARLDAPQCYKLLSASDKLVKTLMFSN
jgi:hypothetical protein